MKQPEKEATFTDRVTRGEDGKYRWKYELSLFKSPVVFWLVLRIFLFIFLGIFAVVTFADALRGLHNFAVNLKIFGIILLVMIAIVSLGYLIYAAMMGGKYIVEFEMDETKILHRQTAAQAKKAKKIANAAMIAGMASGNPGTVAAGVAATNTEMTSELEKVKRIICRPAFHLIKLNAPLNHNQVYVSSEDYELVKNYLFSHCPNAKGKRG